jgi:hypothetical protein
MECTVVMRPSSMPKLSSMTYGSTGDQLKRGKERAVERARVGNGTREGMGESMRKKVVRGVRVGCELHARREYEG